MNRPHLRASVCLASNAHTQRPLSMSPFPMVKNRAGSHMRWGEAVASVANWQMDALGSPRLCWATSVNCLFHRATAPAVKLTQGEAAFREVKLLVIIIVAIKG